MASATAATLAALTPDIDPLRGVDHLILLRFTGRSHESMLGHRDAAGPLELPTATGTTDEVMTAPAATDPGAIAFLPSMLPVLSRLADEFANFDAWYADGTDPAIRAVRSAERAGVTWSVFYPDEQGASVLALEHRELLGRELGSFTPMSQFHRSIAARTLPRVSVIEPRSLFAAADLATFAQTGRDRSPDIRHAERLLHEVYSAVRAAPPNVALLLLSAGDDRDPSVRQRVPTILVSAFARTGVVVSEPLDHAVIDAFIRSDRSAAARGALSAAVDPTSYRPPRNWPATTPAWIPDAVPSTEPADLRLAAAARRAAELLGHVGPPPITEADAIALVRAAGARLRPQ